MAEIDPVFKGKKKGGGGGGGVSEGREGREGGREELQRVRSCTYSRHARRAPDQFDLMRNKASKYYARNNSAEFTQPGPFSDAGSQHRQHSVAAPL